MIWNPWRRVRELLAAVRRLEQELSAVQRHADLMADRYEKIRDMNAHLREALRMYRNNVEPAPVLLEYIDQPLPPVFPELSGRQ